MEYDAGVFVGVGYGGLEQRKHLVIPNSRNAHSLQKLVCFEIHRLAN
jgi:hypothetical protein